MRIVTYDLVDETFYMEQIVRALGMELDATGKTNCPFHNDKNASLLVDDKVAYCFACKRTWPMVAFVSDYLIREVDSSHIGGFRWFERNWETIPESDSTFKPSRSAGYKGPVDPTLVEYFHAKLPVEVRQALRQERLFTDRTIDTYRIGWRNDLPAITIPFWRGVPGKSEIDILQFRRQDSNPKYIGLRHHNRSSLMNAHILEKTQPFVVVLFGSFDAILALQDSIPAVGLNGKDVGKSEQERIKAMFSKQHTIYVVPDHTESEFKSAEQLAELLGAEVRYFPEYVEDDTDYISYRYTHTARDFRAHVLGTMPVTIPDTWVVKNVWSLFKVGDRYDFIPFHLRSVRGQVVGDIAKTLALFPQPTRLSEITWRVIQKQLRSCSSVEELEYILSKKNLMGAW